MTAKDLIRKLRELIQKGTLESTQDNLKYWEMAGNALVILEEKEAFLELWSSDDLIRFLVRSVKGNQDLTLAISALQIADADALIKAMNEGTAALKAYTQKMEATKKAVIEILQKLGEMGIRILLGLILI